MHRLAETPRYVSLLVERVSSREKRGLGPGVYHGYARLAMLHP